MTRAEHRIEALFSICLSVWVERIGNKDSRGRRGGHGGGEQDAPDKRR
jgi:hypothetical protein